MFARSISTTDIERLDADLRVDMAGANGRQDWYPAIWRASPSIMSRRMRPTLSSQEKAYDLPFISEIPEVRFDILHPEFASEYGNKHRWANVVRLRDWTFENQIARAFPCDFRASKFTRFGLWTETILSTTEGFVIFPLYKNMTERWKIPDGTTAIQDWFKTHGIKAVLSNAGRITQQIIQTMGGFHGVRSLAHGEIIKFLNEMSRRPISRSAPRNEL